MNLASHFDLSSRPVRWIITILLLSSGILFYSSMALMGGFGSHPPLLYAGFGAFLAASLIAIIRPVKPNALIVLALAIPAAFALLVQQHNLFEGLAGRLKDIPLLSLLCANIGAGAFIGALIVCPLAFLAVLAAALTLHLRGKRRSH